MLNKEQLFKTKECIEQSSKFGCKECVNFNNECPAFESELIETAIKYNEMLEFILDVIKPMVKDWSICPICNGSWHEHKEGCQLKDVVDRAIDMLNS
ncbi:hypothetical protein EJM73_06290 [Clostridium botulinum]|uniref:hypothetical protein n=1 Tax=Clostridium botulinum TaxID=1491 RepID=UPI0007E09E01|nr:hypothetical protein [Clostridium botulinum]KEI84132.1 hypothetical protein N493_19775 [Clostridium botulinum B2 433]NCI20860.1 hypothetical protein [Clostridium botulinum]NCI35274.1 hypothetical protein [Clostridium botulinum]NCI72134.1 hypothetical protein [Clostridium botulinum]NDI38247.1 hypothetical protein [Clostridium botulinum]